MNNLYLPHLIVEQLFKNKNKIVLADSTTLEFTGEKSLISAIALKTVIKPSIQNQQNIGLIVPATAIGTIVNLSLMMLGKTLVNLNYTMSYEAIKNSMEQANIKTIITSKKFVKKLEQKGLDFHTLFDEYVIIYLEDLKQKISKFLLLKILFEVKIFGKNYLLKKHIVKRDIKDTAIILFSSGSEGIPKGIELSYENISGNINQIRELLHFKNSDVMLGILPLFHSFGFTVTTFLPLVEGILCVSHPDPTDGYEVAKIVHKYKATIMCATPTFLRLYTINKKIESNMLESLNFVVSGAEKLHQEIKKEFETKFNKEIIEGYGTTETSPVISCNIPAYLKHYFNHPIGKRDGTVGFAIPNTSIKIVDPHSFIELQNNQEGMVIVSGVQVMKGYLDNQAKTNEVIKMINNQRYYITGDKGKIDNDGFLVLIDRYSRFAKIGGEMISLGAIEEKIASVIMYDEFDFIVTSIEDEKKGEKIVLLFSSNQLIDIHTFKHNLMQNFENKLLLPHVLYQVEQVPKLGTGKKDFKGAKDLAKSLSIK